MAALSGAALALGLVAYDQMVALLQLQAPYTSALLVAVLAILFFVPVVLFVSGTKFFTFGWKDIASGHFWREFLQLFVRGLCWLAGAGLVWAIFAAIASIKA